jgi:hypothetical protein
MGLREDLQSKARYVLATKLGNTSERVTYRSKVTTSFAPHLTVGQQVSSLFTDVTNVPASLGKEETADKEGGQNKVRQRKRAVLIANLDLPGVTPKPGDEILITPPDGSAVQTWKVGTVTSDPSQATWEMMTTYP